MLGDFAGKVRRRLRRGASEIWSELSERLARRRAAWGACDVLLLDMSRTERPHWDDARAALRSQFQRLGLRVRLARLWRHLGDDWEGPAEFGAPKVVVCLGAAPKHFIKPRGALMVQVVASELGGPQSMLVTKRDCEILLCTTSEAFQSLKKQFPRKEVRDVSSSTQAIVDDVAACLDVLGLSPGIAASPIRSVRRRGQRLIDLYITTSQRAECFEKTFHAVMRAREATEHIVRIHVFVDRLDRKTLAVVDPYLEEISLITTSFQLGLPFLYNMILSHQESLDARSEEFADYLCYIQDDCLIANEKVYFDFMVSAYEEVLPMGEVGYVSGFYCAIHPGFRVVEFRQKKVLLSDSIDGKNFMAPPTLMRKVGPLSWYFRDGERRGNPGPKRGSHFDLWQWKESPNSLTKQRRVSIVIPDLCRHLAQSADDSTWGNETSEERQLQRRAAGQIYQTRPALPLPPVIENDFWPEDLLGR